MGFARGLWDVGSSAPTIIGCCAMAAPLPGSAIGRSGCLIWPLLRCGTKDSAGRPSNRQGFRYGRAAERPFRHAVVAGVADRLVGGCAWGMTLISVVLILASLALDVVDLPDSFSDNWAFGVWGVSVWVTGVAAVVTGVVAMTRRHERCWIVVVATLLGFLPVALLLSEAALGKV